MNSSKSAGPRGRGLKKAVRDVLAAGIRDPSARLLERFSPRSLTGPLFSLIISTDPKVKWPAVTALGGVAAALAAEDMESARVIIRRFMWQLNDESGGIGWGCPEAMAEALSNHPGLAREYAPMLISYINEDGNFLEYEPLQRGAVWGIGRLAQSRPELLGDAVPHLIKHLGSRDGPLAGLAAWALGLLRAGEAAERIAQLKGDDRKVELYRDTRVKTVTVSELAEEALERIEVPSG